MRALRRVCAPMGCAQPRVGRAQRLAHIRPGIHPQGDGWRVTRRAWRGAGGSARGSDLPRDLSRQRPAFDSRLFATAPRAEGRVNCARRRCADSEMRVRALALGAVRMAGAPSVDVSRYPAARFREAQALRETWSEALRRVHSVGPPVLPEMRSHASRVRGVRTLVVRYSCRVAYAPATCPSVKWALKPP